MSLRLNVHLLPLIVSALFALSVIGIRLKAAGRPTSERKIIIPPLGMSTGFAMFIFPFMRIPFTWGLLAFLAGALFFSYPLIRTSKFEAIEGHIYLKRSKAFIVILLVLLVIRLILHDYVEQYVSLGQTGALFFLLAFGMLLPWRLAMLVQYRKAARTLVSDGQVATD
ncbi:CcdC family protein [Gorillibacterium timonense]|uniref:CcdC family protein n=1 Tax=Gorillibacterium timonense TaxID=1689269 RepID=UPI00071CDB39|nr:cytochrome c biogenesis protein CcdC [Gorillibacterium timonense]